MKILSLFITGSLIFLSFFYSVQVKADWEIITEINGEGLPYIRSAAKSPDGSVYFGTGNGVFHCKNNVWEKLSSGYTPGIAVDNEGNLWVSKESGLWHVSDSLWVNIPLDDSIKSIPRNLTVTPDGSLWCSTEEGVWQYDNSGWKQYSIKDGLFSDFVTFLTSGPDGNIWCSYGDTGWCENCAPVGGVSRFDGINWVTYNIDDGLGSNMVYSIAAFNDDLVCAATENGLCKFNGTSWEIFYGTSKTIVFDETGNLWLFRYGPEKYLERYDGVVWERIECTKSVILYGALKLLASSDNTIWVAANTELSGCILKFSDETVSIGEIPQCTLISNVHPNPFNPSTTISFNLSESVDVKLSIYNIAGQKIAILADETLSAGYHSFLWEAKGVSAGIYFYILESMGKKSFGKMMLLK